MKYIIYFAALFVFFRIIPYEMQDYVLLISGSVCLVMGFYHLIIPFKTINGIRHEDLPAYSKAVGFLMLPIGICMILISINTILNIFDNIFANVLPVIVIIFSCIALQVLFLIYKKRNRDSS